uniref:hypothetical protein n=1 Tax=Xiphosiphonia pinnulata TaxID=2305477 RepID=UPI0022FD69D1|nr:hypothetical protein PN189_pgp129 [Xiphosiphonia pinnulata]WAX03454.1 hypothetical protein [Xiphosiphonia pinnulata]
MCICINCKHIDLCKTYKFIEKQHSNYNLNKKQNYFIPINTMIIVSINKQNLNIYLDWDVKECLSFVEQPGKWISLL